MPAISDTDPDTSAVIGPRRGFAPLPRWLLGAEDAQRRPRACSEQAEPDARGFKALVHLMETTYPAALGLLDGDFRMVHLNGVLAALHGNPREDQIGRSLTELVPELAAAIEGAFRVMVETRVPAPSIAVEGAAPSAPDDRRCWVVTMHPVETDAAGLPVAIGLMVVDVTEQRRRDALRSAVLDNMVEGVVVCELDRTITFVNPAAAATLGWTVDDLCGQSLDVVVPCERSHCQRVCHPEGEDGDGPGKPQADTLFTRRDGSALPVMYSAAPLPARGQVTGCVTVFRDVTEEKAADLRVQRELEALSWLGRIRDALTDDRFVLYAQPIVALDGGTGGEELLIRMRLPSGEIVLPDRFLPVAERFGLIVEIDRWVIAQAVRLARPGRDIGVNLSARSVSDPTLLPFVGAQLEAAGTDPANVFFEITETALMENLDAGQRLVEGLAALGSGVALDDFGTGFGSFTYLKRLPLRLLKIDSEFVSELVDEPVNRHLVKATVGLARDFGYKTVAEGIEDAETLAIVRELGVDWAQGYFLGCPAPVKP